MQKLSWGLIWSLSVSVLINALLFLLFYFLYENLPDCPSFPIDEDFHCQTGFYNFYLHTLQEHSTYLSLFDPLTFAATLFTASFIVAILYWFLCALSYRYGDPDDITMSCYKWAWHIISSKKFVKFLIIMSLIIIFAPEYIHYPFLLIFLAWGYIILPVCAFHPKTITEERPKKWFIPYWAGFFPISLYVLGLLFDFVVIPYVTPYLTMITWIFFPYLYFQALNSPSKSVDLNSLKQRVIFRSLVGFNAMLFLRPLLFIIPLLAISAFGYTFSEHLLPQIASKLQNSGTDIPYALGLLDQYIRTYGLQTLIALLGLLNTFLMLASARFLYLYRND